MRMDNLSKKILKRFLLLSLFLFLILGSISYFWIKQLYVEQIRTDLIHDLDIIELELKKSRDFQKLADDIKRLTSIRITIIDKDGRVLADSDAKASKMENHKNRPEVFDATYKPYGTSIRKSHTIGKELLYVAKKIRLDGREYFLRVATNFDVVYDHFVAFMGKITVLFLLFMGGFIYIIYRVSDEIKVETDRVVGFLESMKDQRNASVISSEILSALSHEFKNPISVISGYSQTLLEDRQVIQIVRYFWMKKRMLC